MAIALYQDYLHLRFMREAALNPLHRRSASSVLIVLSSLCLSPALAVSPQLASTGSSTSLDLDLEQLPKDHFRTKNNTQSCYRMQLYLPEATMFDIAAFKPEEIVVNASAADAAATNTTTATSATVSPTSSVSPDSNAATAINQTETTAAPTEATTSQTEAAAPAAAATAASLLATTKRRAAAGTGTEVFVKTLFEVVASIVQDPSARYSLLDIRAAYGDGLRMLKEKAEKKQQAGDSAAEAAVDSATAAAQAAGEPAALIEQRVNGSRSEGPVLTMAEMYRQTMTYLFMFQQQQLQTRNASGNVSTAGATSTTADVVPAENETRTKGIIVDFEVSTSLDGTKQAFTKLKAALADPKSALQSGRLGKTLLKGASLGAKRVPQDQEIRAGTSGQAATATLAGLTSNAMFFGQSAGWLVLSVMAIAAYLL